MKRFVLLVWTLIAVVNSQEPSCRCQCVTQGTSSTIVATTSMSPVITSTAAGMKTTAGTTTSTAAGMKSTADTTTSTAAGMKTTADSTTSVVTNTTSTITNITSTTPSINATTKKEPCVISKKCLDCICGAESNGNKPGCGQEYKNGKCTKGPAKGKVGCKDDGARCSCGPFQIQSPYFEDCKERTNLPIKDWVGCSLNEACARQCTQAYLCRYGRHCFKKPLNQLSCEEFGRIHNGGPGLCNKDATKAHGEKVKKCCAGHGC